MLPVTVGLGLINFGQVIDSTIGFTVSESAPRAIDAAFRLYMLPQGMFSVAVATVLFPALSRFVSRGDLDGLRSLLATGMRGVFLLLIPCAAITLVLAEPITRLVYQRGAFNASSTDEVSTALLWFSFSLPFSGVNLLLTRTFFSLQRPWLVTRLSGIVLVLNVGDVDRARGTARDRGDRHRHRGVDVRHDRPAGATAAHRAARPAGGGTHAAARSRACSPPRSR